MSVVTEISFLCDNAIPQTTGMLRSAVAPATSFKSLAPYRDCLGGKDTGTVICWGRGSFDRGDLKEAAGAAIRAMEPQA